MKILMAHNYYRHPGGEDRVFRGERELLQSAGHEVVEYTRSNDEIVEHGILSSVSLAGRTLWAWDSERQLRAILQREKPWIAHFHNILPLISPSAYYACRDAGVPIIQALHNYRLICPGANLYRDGQLCEECLSDGLFRGVLHGCYRQSRAATATVGTMLALHHRLSTWTEVVGLYIAPTEFLRQKFVRAGIPLNKISLKPNPVYPDPGVRTETGAYALYVGRLVAEKGLGTLLQAWKLIKGSVPLRIVGDGPKRQAFEATKEQACLSDVCFDGWLTPERLRSVMKNAAFLVFPSEWYESFGLTIIEAFACGVPVITSRLGAMMEIVENGKTGLHFTPGDAKDLASKVEWAWTHSKEMETMGKAARAEYQAKYTAEQNYQTLMGIYERARNAMTRKAA